MNQETKTQIQQKLLQEKEGGRFVSQNEMSRELGVSPAYMSRILNGKWDERHPSEVVWAKLAQRYNLEAHYDTGDYKVGYEVVKEAHLNKGIVLISGEYGFGKSYLFQRYKANNRQVYVITCRDSMNRKELLWEVAVAIGLKEKDLPKSQAKVEYLIQEELKDKDALLIFDECEGVKVQIFATIKNLRRLLEYNTGFVVAGKDLYEDFTKKARRNKAVGALHNRVRNHNISFMGLTLADVQHIAKSFGFSLGKRIASDLAEAYPDIRNFLPLIKRLVARSDANGGKITESDLAEVFI